jgi:small ligand-binding sensory domain FIST
MRWASTVGAGDHFPQAVETAIDGLEAELQTEPDVIFAFVTSRHRAVWDALPRLTRRRFPKGALVGCGAAGVIGGGREHENRPAVALVGVSLPGVEITTAHVDPEDVFSSSDSHPPWMDRFRKSSVLVAIPDNSSVDGEAFIELTNRHLPEATVLGGFASGASASGGNMLFHDSDHHATGATLLGLGGDFRMDTVIAQGCRPVGQPLFVTGAHENLITSLDEKAPSAVLHELIEGLSPKDQELLRYSLFLGIGMAPGRNRYDVGDFLIRNIAGFDPEGGALAVAAPIRIGQVVQFHLRDAETSTRDLRKQLRSWSEKKDAVSPEGALLFTCLGRGQHLYGVANHDSSVIAEHLGPIPIGGFFCAGEIGPVGGRTFVHGYTSVLGLFSS